VWASGSKETTPELAGQKVTVTYWHTMSDPEAAQLNKVISAFEEENPNITIKPTKFAYDDFKTAILTAVAGGDVPDTARIDIIWVPEFADKGWLLRLDGNMAGFETLINRTFPGPRATARWKEHYYGLPQNTNTQVLLWNKERFDQAGIDGPPATIQEFAADARKLSNPGKEQYGYALGGTYFWAPAPIFYAMGGRIVSPDLTTADGYINGPESVRAFTLLTQLYKDGAISPNLLGGGIGTSDGHASGKYAMIIDGPWMVDIYADTYPDFNVHFAMIPKGPDGNTSSVVGGEDAVIFDGSTHKEAAKKWLAYLLSSDAQKTMAQVGVIPTLSELRGDPALPDYFDVFMQQLQTARARVAHPRWSDMDGAINNAFQRMLRGDQSPQAALDQAAKEIDKLLAE